MSDSNISSFKKRAPTHGTVETVFTHETALQLHKVHQQFPTMCIHIMMHMGVSWNRATRLRGYPVHHPFIDGIFHEINQPFWGHPHDELETSISSTWMMYKNSTAAPRRSSGSKKKNNKNIPQTGFATDGKHSVGDHITTLGESGRQLIHQLFHVLFDDQSSK